MIIQEKAKMIVIMGLSMKIQKVIESRKQKQLNKPKNNKRKNCIDQKINQ